MMPGHSEHEMPDALPGGPAHRRGAALNPANRFQTYRFHLSGDEVDRHAAERADEGDERPPRVPLQVLADQTGRIINRVAPTSDVPFDWTVNPYRGCEHGCIYCFARPYHEFLGFSCGLDFETKIMVKHEAPELLKRELASPGWRGEPIVMSAITDVYQPIEKELELTRRCLEIMADCSQAVSTMTKSALVLRDIELWQRLAVTNSGQVTITIVTLDDAMAKKLEPRAASPARRLRVVRELVDAGIPTSVNIAPVIPGLTDREIPRLLEAVADAGARSIGWVMLRLPYQLKDLFLDWLKRSVHPKRAAHVESLIRQMRGGRLYDATMGVRGRGKGNFAQHISQMFEVFTKKYRLDRTLEPLNTSAFRPPNRDQQLSLFG